VKFLENIRIEISPIQHILCMYVIYSDGSGRRRRRLGRIDEAFFPRRAFRTITRTIAFFILLFVFFFFFDERVKN